MFHRLRRPLSTLGAAAGAAALGATLQKSRQAESESDPLNPYKVGATLGQGAFAIVKLVTSRLTGEEFALKLVDKRWTKASAMEQELAVLRAVGRHRNVVGMVESFEMKDVYGLVLELATGGEVFDRLCDRGTYTERDAAALVRQVTSALQHIHRADVVHRDIKPENLLHVDASEEAPVKVCDFGLSVFYGGEHPKTKGTGGTTAYMAPEMLKALANKSGDAEGLGPPVDMWAVGVVLFILLGGYHPFDPDGLADDKKMAKAILACRWAFDDPAWEEVSGEAKAVVKALLAPKAAKRPSASQLLAMPWVKGDTASDTSLASAQGQLRAFNDARRTWRAAAAAAAMVASAAPDETSTGAVGGTGAVEPLSEEVVQEMKLAFAAFDVDGSGVIDTKELGEAMRRMGLSKDDARAAMLRVDADCDGSISFGEFCTAMAPMYSQNTQMLRRAFRFFDADNSGFIDREELSAMLTKLRMAPPSEAALEAAFQAADANGDNKISFTEFIHILTPASNSKLEHQVRSASR